MTARSLGIFHNDSEQSKSLADKLAKNMQRQGFSVSAGLQPDNELLICVGGDGTTLSAIHTFNFPQIPILGINTGHLGFFQEVRPEEVERFMEAYLEGRYTLQPTTLVQAAVTDSSGVHLLKGFNEIVVKGPHSNVVHLDIAIGDSPIERFSGDGILIATATGSTGYNYSLGGSIVDPRLELLQVTPIAPMNTTAFRSFTASLLLPPDMTLDITPEYLTMHELCLTNDGIENMFQEATRIEIGLSDTVVNLLRFENYDFWAKAKSKFL